MERNYKIGNNESVRLTAEIERSTGLWASMNRETLEVTLRVPRTRKIVGVFPLDALAVKKAICWDVKPASELQAVIQTRREEELKERT